MIINALFQSPPKWSANMIRLTSQHNLLDRFCQRWDTTRWNSRGPVLYQRFLELQGRDCIYALFQSPPKWSADMFIHGLPASDRPINI